MRSLGQGQAYFRARFLLNNEKNLLRYCTNRFYRNEALMPSMTWAGQPNPQSPAVRVEEERWALHLNWPQVDGAVHYNIYHLDAKTDNLDSARVLAYYHKSTRYDYTPALPSELWARIAITAVDRYGQESAPAIVRAAQGDTLPLQHERLIIPDTLDCAVLIVDKTGRIVRHIPRRRHEVYIARLAPGFYELRTDEHRPQTLRHFWKN